ncbi:hypothetical protein BDY21DRAFT_352238 [Lineolata rhizophorae]|uniref:Uncharacterized protein n=1 Tax=Lineolata rhizophorae TaxID=578093 RepID=A0A6A6NS50_9PEZI|nr:hypothetical protein BDY21DRAFT_352238 [Lineolata rhizophorae]
MRQNWGGTRKGPQNACLLLPFACLFFSFAFLSPFLGRGGFKGRAHEARRAGRPDSFKPGDGTVWPVPGDPHLTEFAGPRGGVGQPRA